VRISILFEIFSNFPFIGGGVDPRGYIWSIKIIAYIAYNTRNNNICGLGVGISIVFEIFSNFLFLRGRLTPGAISNVLHILPVTLSICF
jgi:hypothetical protein